MRLNNGDLFPSVSGPILGGGKLTIPEDLKQEWNVVLFYRGHWWAFCNLQFADFGAHQEEFKNAGIGVVALSVDREEDARKMVEKHNIEFSVVYGLDVRKEAEKIDAYFDSENGYFQPANFILRDGKVVQATYSSGPLGRLQAEQVLMLIDHYRKEGKG